MNWKVLFLVGGLMAVSTGCATKRGSFALVDLDFRTKEQYEGSAILALAQQGKSPTEGQVKVGAVPEGVWYKVLDFLGIARGRMRLFCFEWYDYPNDALSAYPLPEDVSCAIWQ